MNMKSVVELIQHRITPIDSEWDKINITRTFHRDDYKSLNVIIEALEDGEKSKANNIELTDENQMLKNHIQDLLGEEDDTISK